MSAKWIVSALAGLAAGGYAKEQAEQRPNIIFILADDAGIGDISCYGAEMIRTPHIDRLAGEGLIAADAHAIASVCTPSRYGFLTGRYYHRYPRNWNGEALVELDRPTIASVFRDNGYATGYFGKVHTGWGEPRSDRQHRQDIDWNSELPRGVLEMGFDTYFGTPFSHNEPPFVFVKDRHVVGLVPDDPIEVPDPNVERGTWNWGLSRGAAAAHAARPEERIDLIVTEKAVDFIHDHRDQPFFVHLSLVAPHVPISPAKEFKGRTELGWYADYVEQMDWCVGEILRVLDELELADNTFVLFASDNGAIYYAREYGMGHRANLHWAGQKTDAWEGGVRVPFTARWPGHIPAGHRVEPLISLMDMPKTLWAAAGIDTPPGAAPDALNVLDLLTGKTNEPIRTELFMIGITGQALRSGDWVYIPKQGSQGVTTDPRMTWAMQIQDLDHDHSDYDEEGSLRPDAPATQLYNLRTDPQQSRNVIREHPETAAELAARFNEVKKRRTTR